jgi:Tfp pilus assembly PilM family ATPase
MTKQINVEVYCSFAASINVSVPSDISEKDLDDFLYEEANKIIHVKVAPSLRTVDGIQIRYVRVNTTEY